MDGLDAGTHAGGGGADEISSGSSAKTGAISSALSDECLATIDGAIGQALARWTRRVRRMAGYFGVQVEMRKLRAVPNAH